MNKRKTLQQPTGQQISVHDSFIISTVTGFADDNNIYDVIKAFQRLKFEWMLSERPNQEAEPRRLKERNCLLSDLHAIENLLCDIAECQCIQESIAFENKILESQS